MSWVEIEVVPKLKTNKRPGQKRSKKRLGVADATLLMEATLTSETMLSDTLLSQTFSNTNLSETILGSKRSATDSQNNTRHKMACEIIEVIIALLKMLLNCFHYVDRLLISIIMPFTVILLADQ